MNFRFLKLDQLMIWFLALIALTFFVAGIFDVLEYIIVKLVLFSCYSFVVANIYYVLHKDENKKSPENDSE